MVQGSTLKIERFWDIEVEGKFVSETCGTFDREGLP
jgi:hypothetical protein